MSCALLDRVGGMIVLGLFLVSAMPLNATELERSAESIASEIQEDRDFLELIKSAARMAGTMNKYLSTMDEASLETHNEFVSNLPIVQAKYEFPEFIAHYGVESSVWVRQKELLERIVTRHHLDTVSRGTVMDGFQAAVGRSEETPIALQRALEYEIEPLDEQPKEVDRDCLKKCRNLYVAEATVALTGYLSTVAGCSMTGPGLPFCLGAATVAYAATLGNTQRHLNNCVAVCEGTEVREDYCESDTDCPSNQFCWTGVAGIGNNECRPQKSADQTCSRHLQCKSGCCKLHFWTNPISKVCRPANKC